MAGVRSLSFLCVFRVFDTHADAVDSDATVDFNERVCKVIDTYAPFLLISNIHAFLWSSLNPHSHSLDICDERRSLMP